MAWHKAQLRTEVAAAAPRLRKAREAAGLTEADLAERLKMPVGVVRSLEAEDWGRLGAPVFVRGQLRSYSRLLGLTTAPMVAASGAAPIEPPVLVPRTFTPPMQRLRAGRTAPGLHRADRRHRGAGLARDATAPRQCRARCGAAGRAREVGSAGRRVRTASSPADPSPLVALLGAGCPPARRCRPALRIL